MSAKTKSAPPSRFARIDAQHRCVPAHTALLVVDMQHGFLHVGASLEVPQGRGLVPRIQRLIACCRSVGTRVIFTKFVYSPAVPCLRGEPFGVEHLPPPDSQPTGHGRPSGNCLVGPRAGQGAESADIIPELAPRPDELVVASHGYGNKPWAAQFDRPLAELMGKTNWDLFPKDTALVFEASDQAARLRGEVSNLLESGIAPDGKRHWWKVFKFPLPGPGGETWIGGLALDVTDLVLAKTRLSDFEKDLADGRLVPEAPHGNLEQVGRLPPRLRQVLELLAAGWTIKETAARLGISQKTAEAHRTKLLQRLGVKSVVEAVRLKLTETSKNNP